MKVRINIDKIAALKAGKDRHGYHVIAVPAESLTHEQREELAKYATSSADREVSADFALHGGTGELTYSTTGVVDPSPDSVKTILDRLIEYRKKEAADKAAEQARQKAELDIDVADFLVKFAIDNSAAIEQNYGTWQPIRLLRCNENDQRLGEAMAWAKGEVKRLAAESKAADEKELAEKAESQAKGIAELKAWAEANGSELLRERIAGEFEWIGLAEKEYGNSVVADFGELLEIPDYEDQEESERTTPSLEEIKRFREVCKIAEGKPASVKLVWSKYTFADQDAIKRAEIVVTVKCPTGRELDYYYPATDNVEAK